jgi:hypothetical protein
MDLWTVLRVASLVGCLALGVFAPEIVVPTLAGRAALSQLGVLGLLREQRAFHDEKRIQLQRSLRGMDGKSPPLPNERDMLLLLEDFTSTVPDAA